MATFLTSLSFAKGPGLDQPVKPRLSVESQEPGLEFGIDIEMTADQLAHLLSGSVLTLEGSLVNLEDAE